MRWAGGFLMDHIFTEESEHLKAVVNMIEDEIAKKSAVSDEFFENTCDSLVRSKDERISLAIDRQTSIKYADEVERLKEIKERPYFARMDFTITNEGQEEMTIYIGEKSLDIGFDNLVYDWRNTLANRFYSNSETNFTINNAKYNLLLKRKFSIENSSLKSYKDEYTSEGEIFKEGIADPFLIQVLQEKKREQKLTNIIRSIQENQNNIIREDINKNIIVQGCAGSGKTMIMLHRLSYILYNYPKLNVDSMIIITPNKVFDVHINNLAKNLEIEEIQRYTIEEYYALLLDMYGVNSNSILKLSKKIMLIMKILINIFIQMNFKLNFVFHTTIELLTYTKRLIKRLYWV